MSEQGIFHVLTTMLLYPPVTEVAAKALGKLAGSTGPAAWRAQVLLPQHCLQCVTTLIAVAAGH